MSRPEPLDPRTATRRALRTAVATTLLAAVALVAAPATAGEDDPTAVVEQLHESLLSMMKEADDLGYAGRYERIEPAVSKLFDIGFMAKLSLGRQWNALSDDERRAWVKLFRRHMASTYAGRFTGWSGQTFETESIEDAASSTKKVHTVLRDPEGDDVELDYRLRKTKAGWRVIDIYLDGDVSELALRRSEYSSVLKNEGFESLQGSVEAKIRDWETGEAS